MPSRSPADAAPDAATAARIEGVGFLMADVTRLLRKGFDRRARSIGLTRPQWRVLVYILQNEGLSQSELARRLELERAPLGQLVRALEALGIVRRERSASDQREWMVRSAEGASRFFPELMAASEWLRDAAFRGISREEQIVMRRLLERMRRNLSDELE